MATHEEYLRSRDLGGLHALRAFAITAVIAHHAQMGGPAHRGVLGVGTFFTISGFIVTTLLLREHARTGTISLRRFHTRRILRIWPLYFAVLGLYTAIVALAERHTAAGAAFFGNLPHFLTFTANWGVPRNVGGRVIFGFAWSLATQEQFFLVWPALLRLGRARVLPMLALLVFPVTELLVTICRAAGLLSEDAVLVGLFQDSVFTPLCLGGLLAFALHARGGFELLNRLAGTRVAPPLAIGLVVCTAWIDAVPIPFFYATVPLLVAAAVLAQPGLFRRVISNPVLVHVGTVSYGMYLLHMLAHNAAHKVAPASAPATVFLLTIPLAFAAATVSYHLFERRVLQLRDVLAGRPRVPAAARAQRASWGFTARTGAAAFTSPAEQQ